jgi:hypothetical protein
MGVLSDNIIMGASGGEVVPDEDTLLLIHSDTTDGSTTFVDSSQTGRTVTVVGHTQHDTAQKKFGASSILFDGTADELTVADSNEWTFAGDFTIDYWIRTGGAYDLIEHGSGTSAAAMSIAMWTGVGGTQVRFEMSDGSTNPTINLTSSTHLGDSNWHHIAVARSSDSWGLWIDGTSEATQSNSMSANNVSAPFAFGDTRVNGAGGSFSGHMDEIRISNAARWVPGEDFDVPTEAYPS